MKVYASVLKLRLLIGMQYRSAALAGVATQFFWGFISIMVFEAFYQFTTETPPISLKELIYGCSRRSLRLLCFGSVITNYSIL
jgi:ABC-2 type transport system permease protein